MRVVDLFSGVGGIALGFQEIEGFNTIFANDVDPDMCKSFQLNFPDKLMVCKSIADLDFKSLANGKDVDVIVGGPPCQAYSTSGKRLLEDPRASLYIQYHRALKELRPKIFIYENVKGLLSMSDGMLFEELTELFASLGYKIQAKVLNAADYGVPQERERVIVVGTAPGITFNYPEPTHRSKFNSISLFSESLPLHITLGEALGDLPLIKAGEKCEEYISNPQNSYQEKMRGLCNKLHDHESPQHGEDLLRVIRNVPEGGIKKDIPEEFRPKSGFPNSYGRLWWDRPATTITRNLGTPSSARCIHPKCDRALTTREGARLQSFPDNFIFYGSRAKKNLQIGNAVPPLLASALARKVAETLK